MMGWVHPRGSPLHTGRIVSRVRLPLAPVVPAALCLALTVACGKAAPTTVPSPPTPAPTPAETPVPQPPPTAEASTEADAVVEAEEGEAGAPGSAEARQKEALELCQAAQEALDRDEVESAITAVDRAYELMLTLPANGDDVYLQGKEDIRVLAADLISRIYRARRRPGVTSASWDRAMPSLTNEHVQREIRSFLGAEREQFIEGYRRSGRYRPMILEKLREAGLPAQLSWLPLVESWFKVRALSRASALGMWQFISSTGLRYGLNRDAWIDQRLNPEKSTDGAIAYLTDLHALFGDWPKALAAYNCGEARVFRLSHGTDYMDFWDLYALLPGETRRYVPRLLAALQILENPARYGLELPEPDSPAVTVAVSVDRSVTLDRLDAALGLEAGTLAELNPELRYKATPGGAYDLRVPAGLPGTDKLREQLAAMPEWKRPAPEYTTHRVRSGETLSTIAKRYGTTASAILRLNKLKSVNRIWPGQNLRIPGRGR